MRFLLPTAIMLAAPALAAAPGLPQMQAHLRAVQTMTADFSQTDAAGKTLIGTLALKRPGRIRFQYGKGVPLLVVGDGKALTMIDYQVRQVSRWPISDSPLSILLNPDRDISAAVRVVPDTPGQLVVEGRDPKHPEFGTITIAFAQLASAPSGLSLKGWTILDAQGRRSVITLSNQRFNVPVNDRTFLWSDPRPQNRAR